jgi:phosphatidylinositol-3-phosphatase
MMRSRLGGRSLTTVLVAGALVFGVAGPAGFATAAPTAAATSSPHVMVIVEENQDYSSIIGNNTDAPYINGLANTYVSATNWFAVQHNSPNDYLELLSGANQGVPAGQPYTVPTLVDELHDQAIPWKGYMESMPSNCSTAGSTADGLYDPVHNPFHYFQRYTTSWCNDLSTEGVVPYPPPGGLVTALTGANAPDFVWITPNDCNDMHGDSNTGSTCKGVTGGPLIKAGDTWLSSNLSGVLTSNWFKQNGTVIVTWDEGAVGSKAGCCGLSAPGGHIATLVISSTNAGKGTFTSPGDHYGTLRGIEEAYGVSPLGGSTNIVNGDLKSAF